MSLYGLRLRHRDAPTEEQVGIAAQSCRNCHTCQAPAESSMCPQLSMLLPCYLQRGFVNSNEAQSHTAACCLSSCLAALAGYCRQTTRVLLPIAHLLLCCDSSRLTVRGINASGLDSCHEILWQLFTNRRCRLELLQSSAPPQPPVCCADLLPGSHPEAAASGGHAAHLLAAAHRQHSTSAVQLPAVVSPGPGARPVAHRLPGGVSEVQLQAQQLAPAPRVQVRCWCALHTKTSGCCTMLSSRPVTPALA